MTKVADQSSSQTQIAQASFDPTFQALKVVNADPSTGGATEATAEEIKVAAEEIKVAVESIDDKTPALVGGKTPVDLAGTTVPLPTGAATEAKQDTEIAALNSIDGKTPALVGGAVPVDGSNVTQPISAASLPLPTGAATESTLSAINTKTPALISGASPVVSGLGIVAHDAVSASFAATTDTYQFYTGGLAGTLVSTVVITYTDATKAVLQSVVRT